ncbi:MAG TPA: hypothetical protein VKU83_00090, partial [Puia sp.]|nr:hypothetical protein [Puia sp.]
MKKRISPPMRITLLPALLLLASILLASMQARAQKAYPVELLGLLGKITVPTDAAACFAGCTKTTDPANGAVSIVNTDPTFKELNDELNKISKAAMDAANAQTSAQAPNADQVQQMQQQAMQQAAAMQGKSPQEIAAAQQARAQSGAPSASELAVLKKMGQAQTAAAQINQLINEMSQKFTKLDKSEIDNVPRGANCPEVQQGGYAGPTCDCLTKRDQAYQSARVAKCNAYLQQVSAIINEYMGKIKVQAAIVDDFEHTAKYGDALSNATYRQLVGSVQQQALGGVVATLAAASSNWEDAAKIYAYL